MDTLSRTGFSDLRIYVKDQADLMKLNAFMARFYREHLKPSLERIGQRKDAVELLSQREQWEMMR